MRWQLDSLYHNFDAKYDEDIEKLKKKIGLFDEMTRAFKDSNEAIIKDYLNLVSQIELLSGRLKTYPYLRYTMNAKDMDAKKRLEDVELILTELTGPNTRFKYWLKEANVDIASLEEGAFHISELLNKSNHMMSEKEENLFSQMNLVAGESWGKLQKSLSSSLLVFIDLEGKEQLLPVNVVIKYMSDSNDKVRETAFNAINKAYETIDKPIALALSNIKRQGNMLANARAYDSVLDETLNISRMSKETLNALLQSIEEFLPICRRYLKAKSLYLGDGEKLKMYNLEAPVGGVDKSYSIDEAKELVVNSFLEFSPKLRDVAKKAFDEKWVDFEPRLGKRGGAFCNNMPYVGESRISVNFNYELSNVITLAHELGHAYHGSIIKENAPYDWTYPMPLAETASIFCEQVFGDHLMETVTEDERLYILELNAMKATRLMIGIISRFWFEDQVISETKNNTLSVDRIKSIMKEAQLRAYGDSIDADYLDTYAWLTKPHYYYLERHYYNFPYSFGFLFAKGLYAMYNDAPETFVKRFDEMLLLTTKATVEDVAQVMDLDITNKEFWTKSLDFVKKDIEEVCELLEKNR